MTSIPKFGDKAGIYIDKIISVPKIEFLINNVNTLHDINPYYDIAIFTYDGNFQFNIPRFAILPAKEAWMFEGPILATTTVDAEAILKFPQATKRYFYLWDLEWLYQPNAYILYKNIYQNDNLELIVQTNEHFKIVKNCWKEPMCIMENFDYKILHKLFTGIEI